VNGTGQPTPASGGVARGESLAAAAIAGDADALRALWQRHRRWVAAILLAHKPRDADLDDLLQDVAAIVVAKVGDLRDEGALRPWLRTVAISVARTAARKRNRGAAGWLRRAISLGAPEALPSAATPGPDADDDTPAVSAAVREEGRRLMELAAQIPEGYREPLLLKCVRGLSYRQIGEMLGLPETTIETRIARGRRMLRELAERDREERTNNGRAGALASVTRAR
jgi:RNA polymerase sigma factor (sigma-70 family)